jgi:hypothetical protein
MYDYDSRRAAYVTFVVALRAVADRDSASAARDWLIPLFEVIRCVDGSRLCSPLCSLSPTRWPAKASRRLRASCLAHACA